MTTSTVLFNASAYGLRGYIDTLSPLVAMHIHGYILRVVEFFLFSMQHFPTETILITMLIEVILILGLFLEIPLIIMEIPTIILMAILIRCPLILRIVLKNL